MKTGGDDLLPWPWWSHASCCRSYERQCRRSNNNVRRTSRNKEYHRRVSVGLRAPLVLTTLTPQTECPSRSRLTMDLLMWVSLLLALLSANSRLLMSFRRALYLLICSLMTSSTHLPTENQSARTARGPRVAPVAQLKWVFVCLGVRET